MTRSSGVAAKGAATRGPRKMRVTLVELRVGARLPAWRGSTLVEAIGDNVRMIRFLAPALALCLCANAAAAASPAVDLHDSAATFEAFKSTQHDSYTAVDAQYRAAITLAP